MAVSWKKLKEGSDQPSAEDIVAYLADPQPAGDYYSEAGQALLMWHTTPRAAVELGIARPGQRPSQQEVRRQTLALLLKGINPRTGQRIRRPGPDGTSVAALDLTLSPAPKSVSVLWALAPPQLRFELEAMVAMAADRAVMRMLREQPFVRERVAPGPQGVRRVRAEDQVAASALHTTARLSASARGVPDPQLHLHYLLLGALDGAGRLRASDSLVLANYQAELEAEASGHLAELLRQRGFEIERKLTVRRSGRPRVAWELRGVPASLVEAMSSRSREIEDLKRRFLAEYGREPEGRAWEAWIVKQRGPKVRLSPAELRLAWAMEGREHGFGPEAAERLLAEADRRRVAGIREITVESPEARELRRLVLEQVCREHAFVPEPALDRLAHQLAVGLVPATLVDRVIAAMYRDADLLRTEDGQVTTLEILALEQRALAAARQLAEAPPAPAVPEALVEAELARRAAEGTPFDEHQAEAVRVATSGARLCSISGPAGTGKGLASAAITALFRAAAIGLWRGQGRRVIALAVPGRTAQQAGADASTDLAMTLDDLEHRLEHGRLELGPEDVLLVDEAGMIDHHRYARLLETAAEARVTVVQIGDDRQLAPVGPGGLWTSTHRLAEVVGTAAELRVVRRAREQREAEAWQALREGRVVEGLSRFRDQGRLRLYATRAELRSGMVEAWWQAGPERGLMVVDSSNQERDELNRLAQRRRLEAGELGAEALALDQGLELHVGDRVLFSAIYRPPAPDGRRVKRVENGTRAVVRALDLERGEVELELEEPTGPRRLRVGREVPLTLGYARHVYKAQGVTVDTAELAVSLRTRLNELYVMATRAREGARIHALAAELEELEADHAEAEVETAGQPELPLEDARTEPAPDEVGTPPAERGRPAVELLAELEEVRRRREELEAVTIHEIACRARPSTKQAVGERPIQGAATVALRREAMDPPRAAGVVAADLDRQDRLVGRWRRSPSLDGKAPKRAQEAARLAIEGKVPRPPAPEPPVLPLPALDPIESVARAHVAGLDTERALACYQLAGRVDYSPTPWLRALERLAADPDAVLVVGPEQLERARAELRARPELEAEVMARGRLVDAEVAYAERQARRQGLAEPWRAEEGAIPRAIVVAEEPWASPALARALSVAAASHLVAPPPVASVARRVDERERQLREQQQQAARQRVAEQAEQARRAARRRREAERRAERAAEHARDGW